MLAGVYALQLSSFAAYSDLTGVALVACVATIACWRRPALAWAGIGVAIFAANASALLAARLDPLYAGDSMVMQVRVVDFPVTKRNTTTFVAQPLGDRRLAGRIRASWFEPPVAVRLGDVWQFELRLRRPRGNRNPGVFDYEAWLFRSRIVATGYVVAGHRNRLLAANVSGPVGRFRQRFVDRIERLFPDDANAAVLAAVSVGARHLVTEEQWERFAITGTSHLMAISGLHVGLAAGGGYVLALLVSALFFPRGHHHYRATVAALIVAGAYAVVTGLAVPAQRAMVMIAFAAIAILRRRRPRPATIAAFACIVLALISPVATMAPGFKLSFAAVLLLLWLARRHYRSRPGTSASVFQATRQLAILQIVLLFGLLPLTVLIFGRIAFAAPAVNLVAVPVFSFVTVPFALVGLLLDGPFTLLGDKALLVAWHSLRGVEELISMASRFPGADLLLPAINGFGWVYLLLPIAWAVLPPGWPGRSIAILGVIGLLVQQPARAPAGCVDIDILDVGQGLAVLARTQSHTLLYDTGPGFRSGGSAADTVILPFLAGRKISRLDTLIVSHGDLDHAGGAATILGELNVGRVFAGEPADVPGKMAQACVAPANWQRDGVAFRILHPAAPVTLEGNDASCVLMVEAGAHRVLLTGDIERPAESALVIADVLPRVDAVVVPHHGSRTSSSLPFVRALSPQYAIVSASYGNRWGFPKPDIVERWETAGASVLDTANSGAIAMRVCADTGITGLKQHRIDARRLWHE